MKLPILVCKRLYLRPFSLNDAKTVQLLAGTKEVAATTLNIPHPYEDGAAEQWISSHQERFKKDESMTLAICLKAPDTLIGAIGLEIHRNNSRGSLGYWIGKEYWNNGYCTEAAKTVIEYGFNEFDLARIYAAHLSHNPASGMVMKKLGMKKEGVFRNHVNKWGHFYDLVYYGILKSEYKSEEG